MRMLYCKYSIYAVVCVLYRSRSVYVKIKQDELSQISHAIKAVTYGKSPREFRVYIIRPPIELPACYITCLKVCMHGKTIVWENCKS